MMYSARRFAFSWWGHLSEWAVALWSGKRLVNARAYHRNGNYNSAIVEWEAEAKNYHRFMRGSISSTGWGHNSNYGVGHNVFSLLLSPLVYLQMVCWGCFWSGCPPNLSCCKPGPPIFGRCSMMQGNPGARLRMRLTLTIWPEMNSTSRRWWWWSLLRERWGSQGRNLFLDCSKESQLWIPIPVFSQALGRMSWGEGQNVLW